jgi:protein-disulfide isomerase
MNRSRRVLLSSAAAIGATLAGCLGSDATSSDGSGGDEPTGPATTNGTGEVNGSASEFGVDHPSATGLAAQPFLGADPGSAPTIIAFEDPSCTDCKRFDHNTFPRIESQLLDPEAASFVYRNYPSGSSWGRPAMGALEATYERSEEAFWRLGDYYFATQSQFGTNNIYSLTDEFLASETDVDADVVIEAVQSGSMQRAVERDVNAGNAASVVSTPTFFLFGDGEFLTEIRGARDYQVFARALGV